MERLATGDEAQTLGEPMSLRVSATQLCSRDPLARLVLDRCRLSTWRVTLATLGAYGVFCLGAGVAISMVYEAAGYQFFSILDVREFPQALFVYLVTAPVLWTLYAGQPAWILQVFEELSQNGVIAMTERGPSLDAFVCQSLCIPLRKVRNLAMAATAAVAVVVLILLTTYPQYFRPSLGLSPFFGFGTGWFLVNPLYFWILWVPLVLLMPTYIVVWLIIRQAVAVRSFWELFTFFELTPKPFYPDGCNGVAAVGNYAMRTASAIIFLGFWLLWMISFPRLFGAPLNLSYATVVAVTAYPLAIPALLIPPVWGAHLAMTKAKARALETVATGIRPLLSETKTGRMAVSMTLVEQLERRYELMDREYRTWPFKVPSLGRFSVLAAIPWLSTLASILSDMYLKTATR